MSLMESLKNLLTSQKKLMSDMEEEVKVLESKDLVNENQHLKKELDQTQEQLQKESAQNLALTKENQSLKSTLYEQIYNEKMHLLQAANQRVELYFAAKTETELNRLKAFEKKAKHHIDKLYKTLQESRVSAAETVYKELLDLRKQINVLVTTAESEFALQAKAYSEEQASDKAKLEKEGLFDEEYKAALKKGNIESLIGLNIFSKIGILFLLIAVIALSRYGYVLLTPLLKGIVIFVLGGLLLGVGEWLNRKIPSIFSIALTSGGIAILYGAISLSHFTLDILSIEIALLLCVLNTLLALVLSLRYKAETITLFAIIGGYLPIVTITDPAMPVWILMLYFLFLNTFLLLISTQKKWTVSIIVGFLFNVASSIYIMHMVLTSRNPDLPFRMQDAYLLLYILLVFLIYTLIPIIATYKRKVTFSLPDILLIAANTIVSAVLLNIAFYSVQLQPYMGALAAIFAAVYLALGWWMERKMSKEKRIISLFYLTGFTFILLFIPFQFDKMWFSLGWLVEGVLLAVYGILKEDRVLKWSGGIAYALSLASFLFGDVLGIYMNTYSLFTLKYSAITFGSIAILAALAYKKTFQNNLAKAIKYATVLNVWFYGLYLVNQEWYQALVHILGYESLNIQYLLQASSIVITLLLAFLVKYIRILYDDWMKVIRVFWFIIGILWLFGLNASYHPIQFTSPSVSPALYIAGTVLLLFLGLLSIASLRELVQDFIVNPLQRSGFFSILISAYTVIILTQNLISHYGFGFQSLLISILYILTATLWILYGFLKRNAMLRRFGLGLSILATAKLVFLDLSGLESFGRMISYFAFGIFLLGISFTYQHFQKLLELQIKDIQNEK
jgi:uncharacterized membrane protein